MIVKKSVVELESVPDKEPVRNVDDGQKEEQQRGRRVPVVAVKQKDPRKPIPRDPYMLRNRSTAASGSSAGQEDALQHGSESQINSAESVLFSMVCQAEKMGDPLTLEEALGSDDGKQWMEAVREELHSLDKNQTWELVDAPA